ncbi:NUDIX hydrolase [Pseudoclavibacter chungangensis]|uniref:NUDIX hydrolase n=1 Tax=Pseudoclavibacter chungangensis TaxID=587635 RepID=A0A7J5BNU1_9MICO|nr:NUDIX domain-containing protein [Pseudoclavibacter chungangensis]KAB1653853.1 NUDIX hydrolase [Pseudoclavibacter chungangensis]NYJ68134.1 8-oxo-dGTP diphosphatase [Pseudoclavibacter chungangensis]
MEHDRVARRVVARRRVRVARSRYRVRTDERADDREDGGVDEAGIERQQPLVSIDVVPVRVTDEGTIEFALHERPYEPFRGEMALPGVLLNGGEQVRAAAARALRDKAGIDETRAIVQFGVFDETMRDPRGPTISIAYLAIVAPGTPATAEWVPSSALVARAATLPFDHASIVEGAFEAIATRLWADEPLTRALTGPTFSTRETARLAADIGGHPPTDPSNLRRWFVQHPRIERAADQTGLGGRDTRWAWQDAEAAHDE